MAFSIETTKSYRWDLDLVKGLAIIAVILYHTGWCDSGYLGVDVFFVLNGFFIIPSLIFRVNDGSFSYVGFLKRRLGRLWPIVIIASTACLGVSLVIPMLPTSFLSLCDSIIASNFFFNNILESLRTKDYWDVVNNYKPLMHTWYLGILVSFYVLVPVVYSIFYKVYKKITNKSLNLVGLTAFLSIISLTLYLLPQFTEGDKFYLLQYRFFEIGIGGIIGCYYKNEEKEDSCLLIQKIPTFTIFVLLFVVVFFGGMFKSTATNEYNLVNANLISGGGIPKQLLLIIAVIFTSVYLIFSKCLKTKEIPQYFIPLVFAGKMSLSLYIWHQIVLAFFRTYINQLTPLSYIIYLTTTALIAIATYKWVEAMQLTKLKVSMLAILLVVTTGVSAYGFMHSGVLRDVPELNVEKSKTSRGMFAVYTDRVHSYDKDFTLENDKRNVLVIGNSFSRDMANILLESDYAETINLSYIYNIDSTYIDRIKKSDVILYFGYKRELPDYFWNHLSPDCHVWGIGTKNFGNMNAVYCHRGEEGYYQIENTIDSTYYVINDILKKEWGDYYIDILQVSTGEHPGAVKLFTANHKIISIDGRHLTEPGAKFFAQKLDLKSILN